MVDRLAIHLAAKDGNLQFWRAQAAQEKAYNAWKSEGFLGECPQVMKGTLIDYITDAVMAALAVSEWGTLMDEELFNVLDTFARAANVIDALPNALPSRTPLRDVLPGVWPTVGDLRRLRDLAAQRGWTRDHDAPQW